MESKVVDATACLGGDNYLPFKINMLRIKFINGFLCKHVLCVNLIKLLFQNI